MSATAPHPPVCRGCLSLRGGLDRHGLCGPCRRSPDVGRELAARAAREHRERTG